MSRSRLVSNRLAGRVTKALHAARTIGSGPAWDISEEPMPKQLTRGHAAKTVTLQVPPDQLHCRQLNQLMQDMRPKARLRGERDDSLVELRIVPHRDPLIRRLFNRDDIAAERLVVRAALAQASLNVTPERLRRLGSPGRLAVLTLQLASGAALDRDVKVAQVRSATEILAGGRKKRSFFGSPIKSRSAWLAQSGANTLVQGNSVRRVQLRRFCMDGTATGSLPALLADIGDKPVSIVASISIFRAAALSFIVEDMKGGKHSPQSLATRIGNRADSALLRLFIARWRGAAAAGKFAQTAFFWFDAVNWLVGALHGARPSSPGATRAPKSPRVVSPVAVPLRRAQNTAPMPKQPPRYVIGKASTPGKHAGVRRLPLVVSAVPQPGRQGISLRLLNQLQSPTRLAGTPALQPLQGAAVRTVSRAAAVKAPVFMPTAKPASAVPASEAERLAPTATLLDMLLKEFLASESLDTSGGRAAETQQASSSKTIFTGSDGTESWTDDRQ
jgi:hypothetical protein